MTDPVDVGADLGSPDLAARLRPPLLRLTRLMRMQRNDGWPTMTQLSALGSVERHGPLSAGDLAAVERVQPPSMTKVIAWLEGAGMVQRDTHPQDKRQAIIEITPAGHSLLEETRSVGDAWLGSRLDQLDANERELLRQAAPVLDKLAGLSSTG